VAKCLSNWSRLYVTAIKLFQASAGQQVKINAETNYIYLHLFAITKAHKHTV